MKIIYSIVLILVSSLASCQGFFSTHIGASDYVEMVNITSYVSSCDYYLTGNYHAENTNNVTEMGFVYSNNVENLDLNNGSKYTVSITTGSYSKSISVFPSNTYYYKAYITKTTGTLYSDTYQIISTPSYPSVSSPPIYSVTESSFKIDVSVASTPYTITNVSVVYNTSSLFNVGQTIVSGGFTSNGTITVSGLSPNTTYYTAIRLSNNCGVGMNYSINRQVTTSEEIVIPPSITTYTANSITENSATVGVYVSNEGSESVTSKGSCWSTSPTPTLSDSYNTYSGGLGTVITSLTGLVQNTTYYVRGYAITSDGATYGNQISFTTTSSSSLASVVINSISVDDECSNTVNCQVADDGGENVTIRGICWSTSINPTVSNPHTPSGGGVGIYSIPVSCLLNGTYYIRAYAINSNGTSYSANTTFTFSKQCDDLNLNSLYTGTVGGTITLPEKSTRIQTVTYTSSAPSIVSVSGNVLNLLGVGSVLITATTTGNASFCPIEQTSTGVLSTD